MARRGLSWVLPALVLLVGVVMLLTGVAQMTVFKPPATVTSQISTTDSHGAPLLMVDSAKLGAKTGQVKVDASGNGAVLIAEGKSDDVAAWVGKTRHLQVTSAADDMKSVTTAAVAGDGPTANPKGSDLWVDQNAGQGSASLDWDLTAQPGSALLVASDGSAELPQKITLTATNDQGTPWAWPLVVIGVIVALIGLVWLFLEITFARRGGGRHSGRRAASTLALLVATAALLGSGALAPSRASAEESGTPSASPSVSDDAASAPVVVQSQLTRILESAAQASTAGDAAKDAKQLQPRMAGSALALRTADYQVQAKAADYPARPAVDGSTLKAQIVSTARSWPRTFLAVTQGATNPVPQVLRFVQSSPRENYKIVSTAQILPGQTLPAAKDASVAPDSLTQKVDGSLSPEAAMTSLATVLANPDSDAKKSFKDSSFVADLKAQQDGIRAKSNDANIDVKHAVDPASVIAYPTRDGGAIVMGDLTGTISGTPKKEGDTLTLTDKASVALAGGDDTTKGYDLVSGESVVLYLPAGSTDAPVTIVGADRGLTSATFKP